MEGVLIAPLLLEASDELLHILDAIARNWTPRTGISEAEIVSYLKQNIRYALDADSLGGLDLFYRYAAECGVIEAMPTLRFLGLPACEFVA